MHSLIDKSCNLKTLVQNITEQDILKLLARKATFDKGFRLMVQQYQERLYWHIRRLVVEHEDANDVIQNCFIKAYKGIDRFEQKSKLYTWLYRIATNEAITFLNKKKRTMAASLDNEEDNLSNQLKADSYFDGNAAQRKLQQALKQLPEKQLLVFNMRYFDNMSYKEISAVLNTSVGGLKASYHHAVKKIEAFILER